MMNVFHAGDGNLHPLIVFDAREPGVWERVHRAGDEILAVCVAAGGVLSGEHGIGLEKREAMPLIFSADDLDAQARLRDAFDPSGRANPQQGAPAGEPLRRAATGARGRVDLMVATAELDDLRDSIGRAAAVAAVGSRTHWEVGGPPPTGDHVVLVHAPGGVVTYDPADLTVTVGAGMHVRRARPGARRGRAGVRARPPRRTTRPWAACSPPGSRVTAGCATDRSAIACSKCASSPPTAAW